MEKKSISFLELMKIGLIRKVIFDNISSFYDIDNLSQTCHQLFYCIQVAKIKKKFLLYNDTQNIFIKNKIDGQISQIISKLEDIECVTQTKFLHQLNTIKKFPGEIVPETNSISFCINQDINNFMVRDEFDLFVKKLLQEININCYTRRNATILKLTNITFFNNDPAILSILSHMNHGNITHILIRYSFFLNNLKWSNINFSNIFKGFPKLQEIQVFGAITFDKYKLLYQNRTIIESILKELSTKPNRTLNLVIIYNLQTKYIVLFNFFYEIALKYKIKVKCSLINILPFLEKEFYYPVPIEKNRNFNSIISHINSVYNTINVSRKFLIVMKNLHYFTNIQRLALEFCRLFNIERGLKRMNELNCNFLSLKHLNKLKRIAFYFDTSLGKRSDLKVKMFHENLKYLAQLMPNTIERLEIKSDAYLTREIVDILNNYMPNIKVLQTFNLSFKDSDCIIPLKNLEALICYGYFPIKIPNTVKLLALCFLKFQKDSNTIFTIQKQLQALSKRFSKKLEEKNGIHVFFNDIKEWKKYKPLLQNYF